jgi:oligopeptidase B
MDEFHWLRDRSDPAVLKHLEAENRRTEEAMRHTRGLQEQLYREIRGRIQETDRSVPEKIDDYWYYSRTEEGKQYPIYCRREPELVLLDQNELAEGCAYLRVGEIRVSPRHDLLAFSTDTDGSEVYTLAVKDLRAGELLPDRIPNTYYGLEWANDNRTLFYTTLDATKRPYRLYRYRLGGESELLFEERDERFYLHLHKARSRRYLFVTLESKTATEVWYLDADAPGGALQVVQPREPNHEYAVEHHDDRFFIVTNAQARNFRLMEAPTAACGKESWREVIPHRQEVKLDGVAAFEGHLAIFERERGLRAIRIRNLSTGETHPVEFPEPVYTVTPGANPEFRTTVLRFEYSSLTTPRSVYDYDMNTRGRTLLKQYEVRGGYDASQYQAERLFASAPDGVEVPISLVYRRGLRLDGRNPCYLYGYGAYGHSIEPAFSSDRLSLLDRGFVYAIAHVRGGGEMGRAWYEDGKLLKKKNTFTDFVACAERLIEAGFTSPERLVASGGSAGGLLVGAVLNLRPELFAAAFTRVPFVDVLNTMLDETLPLTVTEFEEWGNPKDPVYYEYIRSYSPYDNLRDAPYPHLLVTAGFNDPRVSYWEPAKWVARLRRHAPPDRVILLKTDLGAGHGGPSGRYERMRETAFEYAFLLDRLGLSTPSPHVPPRTDAGPSG